MQFGAINDDRLYVPMSIRNNYMSIIALYAPENLIHTYYTMACKDCTDTAFNQYCELCYEVVDTEKCYHCHYGLRLNNCKDCFFCEDCTSCSDCFGCKNLHQQQYCIFNEQKSPEEYKEFMESCKLDSHDFVQTNIKKSKEFFEKLPHRSNVLIDTLFYKPLHDHQLFSNWYKNHPDLTFSVYFIVYRGIMHQSIERFF